MKNKNLFTNTDWRTSPVEFEPIVRSLLDILKSILITVSALKPENYTLSESTKRNSEKHEFIRKTK